MARKRRQLGSSAAIHTQQAVKAVNDIERAAVGATNKARNGRCTAATLAYAEMQQAIGRYEAHTKSGGQAWEPLTAIREAAYAYNQHCVRDDSFHAMNGRRRTRRNPRRK